MNLNQIESFHQDDLRIRQAVAFRGLKLRSSITRVCHILETEQEEVPETMLVDLSYEDLLAISRLILFFNHPDQPPDPNTRPLVEGLHEKLNEPRINRFLVDSCPLPEAGDNE